MLSSDSVWRVTQVLTAMRMAEITNLVSGELRPVCMRYVFPLVYQPELTSTLKVEAPKAHAYDIADLRRNDPSKGEATLYATVATCMRRYHRVVDGVVQFWFTRDGLPGYWQPYIDQAWGHGALRNAIELTPPRVKYRPTQQDYERGIANRRAKHASQSVAIQNSIAELKNKQLHLQTHRKIARAQNLLRACLYNRIEAGARV